MKCPMCGTYPTPGGILKSCAPREDCNLCNGTGFVMSTNEVRKVIRLEKQITVWKEGLAFDNWTDPKEIKAKIHKALEEIKEIYGVCASVEKGR